MQIFPTADSPPDLQGATLIVAAVAQGNVGELCVDVMIANTGATLVGVLEDDNVLAVAGNDAHDMSQPGTLSTALELFEIQAADRSGDAGSGGAPGIVGRVFVMQQRAPAMLGRQSEFAEGVVEWAQSQGVGQLLVLSGLDATLRRDRQIEGPLLRYLSSGATELAAAVEAQRVPQLEEEYLAEERAAHGALPPWPLLAAAARRGCPAVLLGCFAAEGDNVPHALQVAGCVLALLGSSSAATPGTGAPGGLRLPCSFAALYGRNTGFDEFLG